MTLLKSLFSSSSQVPTSPKTATAQAATVDMPSRNRGPSVVARLMGLDMFPPETVAERKENVVLDGSNNRLPDVNKSSSAQARTPDGGKPVDKQFQSEFKLRQSSQGGAECLQALHLEELNKQLLAKHMQVLSELEEAKQHASGKMGPPVQKQRRGLSDSTEYMDALELLQANRQFFENYFQNAAGVQPGAKVAAADRRSSYLRNGQSSPRPIVEASLKQPERSKPMAELQPRSHSAGVQSYRQVRESATGEVLSSNTKANTKLSDKAAKDAKDIAKLIAKKIKESIAKDVVKTFSSKVDTAVSPRSSSTPQKASPRSAGGDKHSGNSRKSSAADAKSPRMQNKSKPAESHSPRSSKSSENCVEGSRKNTRSSENGVSGPRKAAAKLPDSSSKVARSGSTQGSSRPLKTTTGTTTSSPKHASSGSPKHSPKVSQRHNKASSDSATRTRTSQTTTKKANNDPSKTKTKSQKNAKPPSTDMETEQQTEVLREAELRGTPPAADIARTPAKIELTTPLADTITPEKVEAAGAAREYSPVSVLDNSFDDEEDVKEVILEPGYTSAQPIHVQEITAVAIDTINTEQNRATESAAECKSLRVGGDRLSTEGIVCPAERQEELLYLRDLLACSGLELMEDGSMVTDLLGFKLDSTLFEKLEERYGDQELASDRVKMHSSAVKRWLIFDLTNEVLSTQACKWKPTTGRELLEELWSNICQYQRVQGDTERKVVALVNAEMGTWAQFKVETTELCRQVEADIFQELLDEVLQLDTFFLQTLAEDDERM